MSVLCRTLPHVFKYVRCFLDHLTDSPQFALRLLYLSILDDFHPAVPELAVLGRLGLDVVDPLPSRHVLRVDVKQVLPHHLPVVVRRGQGVSQPGLVSSETSGGQSVAAWG